VPIWTHTTAGEHRSERRSSSKGLGLQGARDLGRLRAEEIPSQTRGTALEDIAQGQLSTSLRRREQSLGKSNLRRSCDVPGPDGGRPYQVNRTSGTAMRAQEHDSRLPGV